MSVNNKEVDILITLKDKNGNTYDSIESLDLDVKVSVNMTYHNYKIEWKFHFPTCLISTFVFDKLNTKYNIIGGR